MKMTADEIISRLGLKPLDIEGGYFRETHRADEMITQAALPARYGGPRSHLTVIYYLLTPQTRSRLHRVKSDEVYHFLLGDPVTMLQLHPAGGGETLVLGQDLSAGQQLQTVVPHMSWQGAMLRDGGQRALMGVTVAPGFEYEDFELAERVDLLAEYPQFAGLIEKLL